MGAKVQDIVKQLNSLVQDRLEHRFKDQRKNNGPVKHLVDQRVNQHPRLLEYISYI